MVQLLDTVGNVSHALSIDDIGKYDQNLPKNPLVKNHWILSLILPTMMGFILSSNIFIRQFTIATQNHNRNCLYNIILIIELKIDHLYMTHTKA